MLENLERRTIKIMSEKEINRAIKRWNLENDDYYNFNTLKSTYALYYLICVFEHRKMKITRIYNNKCERKIFKPRKQFRFTLV